MPYLQIVYVSSASPALGAEALADILRVSRRNNRASGVTGALLHAEGTFVQALEGPPHALGPTLSRIERDPRHQRLTVLLRHEVGVRSFQEWSMAVVRPDRLPPDERREVRSLLETSGGGLHAAQQILASFQRHVSGLLVPA